MDAKDEVRAALALFDRTFAAGDGAALAELFTDDGRMLLLYREPLEGRAAIREYNERVFAEWDPGAWRTTPDIVEVHGDRAYALTIYSETLVHRAGEKPSLLVNGRLVHFLRRDPDATWRVAVVMNSHSRRVEEQDPPG